MQRDPDLCSYLQNLGRKNNTSSLRLEIFQKSIYKAWRALMKAAGITGLRIHDLRHSYASHLASGGASLPLIGALLGHSNPSTTARYAHLFSDPLRAATEKVGAVIVAAGKPAPSEPVKLKEGA
jgi:integrase